jgi:hypothetical protein
LGVYDWRETIHTCLRSFVLVCDAHCRLLFFKILKPKCTNCDCLKMVLI